MITTHALTILVGALAFAFVLIGAGVVYLQRHIDEGLAKVNKRLDALEPGHSPRPRPATPPWPSAP